MDGWARELRDRAGIAREANFCKKQIGVRMRDADP
jgi:hypothetical protein